MLPGNHDAIDIGGNLAKNLQKRNKNYLDEIETRLLKKTINQSSLIV